MRRSVFVLSPTVIQQRTAYNESNGVRRWLRMEFPNGHSLSVIVPMGDWKAPHPWETLASDGRQLYWRSWPEVVAEARRVQRLAPWRIWLAEMRKWWSSRPRWQSRRKHP